MNGPFEIHRDKRISEMSEEILNSKEKNTDEIKTFGQRVKKAWKNIDEKK